MSFKKANPKEEIEKAIQKNPMLEREIEKANKEYEEALGVTKNIITRTTPPPPPPKTRKGDIKMDYKEAIETIRKNYPTENYTMLREALDVAIKVLEETPTKVMCGLITCIHNNGKRVCSNKNLELNYFDDYSIFKDEKLPNTDTKITDYLSTHIGHFMGVQCKDFKMDKYKVMRNPKNG